MSARIENHRIAGTRITVYDVLHYLEAGRWTPAEIAEALRLSSEQVDAAIRYIEEHRDEVMAVHRRIEERNARGNPPEVEAKGSRTRPRGDGRPACRRRGPTGGPPVATSIRPAGSKAWESHARLR